MSMLNGWIDMNGTFTVNSYNSNIKAYDTLNSLVLNYQYPSTCFKVLLDVRPMKQASFVRNPDRLCPLIMEFMRREMSTFTNRAL